ncbi:ABC-type transport auxiliary lipoprotein family protein [Sphingobium ummariense]|uniref:ABC-type transport auxiliary lipoprotein component domain-containing protein n=1 Tax=Sphingobium ummariense RL-3 TaxID=1346791 RepID=T0KC07_9SPHN|nr:hypothetical protein M529_17255 [Sphingobium ummariense RL-3]
MMFHKKPYAPGSVFLLATAFALAGCVSIGGKPPQQLLTLDPAQKVQAGTPRAAATGPGLIILDPEAPRVIDTIRVAVQTTPTSAAYVTKVQWAETPRHLFQRLLAETVSATSNRMVLDPGQSGDERTQRLTGELISFGLDARTNSAVVTYEAVLTNITGTVVARQRFTATQPVGGKIEANTIGAPLNAAANKVAADVAAWLGIAGG